MDDDSIITLKNDQFAIARGAMIQMSFGKPSVAGPSLSANRANPYVFILRQFGIWFTLL
jgi:hypothetical protein